MSADSESGKTKGSSKLSLLGNIALILGLLVVIAGGVVGWLMPPPPPPPVETISLMEEEPAPSESTSLLEVLSPSEKDTPDVEVEEVLEVEEVMLVDANQVPPLLLNIMCRLRIVSTGNVSGNIVDCCPVKAIGHESRTLSKACLSEKCVPNHYIPPNDQLL